MVGYDVVVLISTVHLEEGSWKRNGGTSKVCLSVVVGGIKLPSLGASCVFSRSRYILLFYFIYCFRVDHFSNELSTFLA